MNVIAVDDEIFALNDLTEVLEECIADTKITGFSKADEALDYARANSIDIAFLDIEMDSMSGLQLAAQLTQINEKTNIIFVTGYSEYALDAFSVYASGYILKPAEKRSVLKALSNLRYPIDTINQPKLRVKTFSNFEVYVNGKPLHFPRAKSKELFAYLIHKNGTGCSLRELASVLYEDKEYTSSLQHQLQTIIATMMKALNSDGVGDVINKRYNHLSVDTSKIDCDYYKFLDGDKDAINSYTGEYMMNYSWGEFTIGYLDSKAFSE